MNRLDEIIDETINRFAARLPSMEHRFFSIGICDFDCYSDQPAQLEAVAHFAPWMIAPHQMERHLYRVVSVVDRAALRTLAGAVSALNPDRVLETFAGQCYHACYSAACEDRQLIFETGENAEHRYGIIKDGRYYYVVLDSECRTLFTYMSRVVREVYLRQSENCGGLSIHAAAFVKNGKAYLLVGDKCAGKTSLMLALTLHSNACYLGNDRVILVPLDERFMVFPFPVSCRIGLGTANALSAAHDILSELSSLQRRQDNSLTITDKEGLRSVLEFGSSVKIELTPFEITSRLGIRHHPGAPLFRIIIPKLDPSCSTPSLEPLAPEELGDVLGAQVFTPDEEKWITPWLLNRTSSVEELRRAARRLTSEVSQKVHGFRLRFGYNYWEGKAVNKNLRKLFDV